MIFDKLRKFDIVFDSPEVDCPPVFSSGDVVSGRVVLDVSGETRVDSLKLHAEGFAKVHWTESRSAGSSTAYTQNYSDEVEYLNRREVLLQAGQCPDSQPGSASSLMACFYHLLPALKGLFLLHQCVCNFCFWYLIYLPVATIVWLT